MQLVPLRCTNKFKQDDGATMVVMLHSADKQSMAIFRLTPVEAEKFAVGTFYDISAELQRKRSDS